MKTFLILDSARCGAERIDEAKALCNQAPGIIFPLSRNELYLESVAPYLFLSENALKEWYSENGWGDCWGVFFDTEASYEACLLHFQRIVIRKDERGSRYFRFYDPRVLRKYLFACDKNKLGELFGPVEAFVMEGDDKETGIQFTLVNGELKQNEITSASLFGLTERTSAKNFPEYR